MMGSIGHVYLHIKKYGSAHRSLYALCVMVFFWTIFDGIVSYVAPLVITEAGLSKTMMGIVIGSSSVAGALFDFLLSKTLENTHFRRLYLLMFAICFVYPLILWQSKIVFIYLIAMALWGFYYDLFNFGNLDFVSRKTREEEHSSSFGLIEVFKALGHVMAPIIAGLLIGALVDWKPFFLSWIFLIAAFVFYLVLVFVNKRDKYEYIKVKTLRHVDIWTEIKLWRRIGKIILPILALTGLVNIVDAFFWTIGPILSESLQGLHPFGGLLITAYIFPSMFMGIFVGGLIKRFGERRLAFGALLGSMLILISLGFLQSIVLMLLVVFVSSILSAIAWPVIQGIYCDYIMEAPRAEKEIEGVVDFSVNIGYIIGPVMAGFLADNLGERHSFTALGIGGAITILLLMRFSRKLARVPKNVV